MSFKRVRLPPWVWPSVDFLGLFFPSISSTHWILHFWKVPPIHIGPMVLGNMDVGLNTQNLMAILLVMALSVINIFGVKTGALIQNIFTFAKVAALFGLMLLGFAVGRNAHAVAANFGGHFWQNAGLGARHAVQVGVGGPIALVGTLTILAVAQVGSLFSADAWNNVTFTAGEVKNPKPQLAAVAGAGYGHRDRSLHRLQLRLPAVLPLRRESDGRDDSGPWHPVRDRRPRGHRGADADVRKQ